MGSSHTDLFQILNGYFNGQSDWPCEIQGELCKWIVARWITYLSNLRLLKCIYFRPSKKARSDTSNSQAHWGWPKLSCRFDGRGMPLAIMICLGKFSKRAVCLKLWLYLLIFVSFNILQSSGGDDEPMSDNEMSRDGDSPDALSRVPPTDIDPETLEKLKQQVSKVLSNLPNLINDIIVHTGQQFSERYFCSPRKNGN